MAEILILELDDDVIQGLEERAALHGRSLDEEVCDILRRAVASEDELVEPLSKRFCLLFEGIGLDEDIPELLGQGARPAGLR